MADSFTCNKIKRSGSFITVIVNVRADLNGRDITKYVEKEISANQKSMRLVRGY